MKLIRIKPFESRSRAQLQEGIARGLRDEWGLHLLHFTDLSSLPQVEKQIGKKEMQIAGSTLLITRILGSSKEGRFAAFAVKTRKLKPDTSGVLRAPRTSPKAK